MTDIVSPSTGEIVPLSETLTASRVGLFRVGLALPDDLDFDTWLSLSRVLESVHSASLWWWGDYLAFGESHYGEKYAAAVDPSGYDVQTLMDAVWVAQKIEFSRRRENLTWSHHREVAALSPEEQDKWLTEAEVNHWSRRELRRRIRAARPRDTVRFPRGKFAVVYADPPWSYDNSGFEQSAASHYPTLTTDEICEFRDARKKRVGDICAPGTVLFMWATSPLLDEAFKVMSAWGFQHKASMVWHKDRAPGIGWWVQTYHELLLIGARSATPQPEKKHPSVVKAPVGEHSGKPMVFGDLIEEMFPGPLDGSHYIELFCRTPRPGWAVFGNEVRSTPDGK